MEGHSPKSDTTKLSLRDPAGTLFEVDGRLIRFVNQHSLAHLNATLESPTFVAFQESGRLAQTRVVPREEGEKYLGKLNQSGWHLDEIGKILEHEKIDFPSFPYEWSPNMLHAAADLTLDLAKKLLPEGMGLKDATPFNVLFDGPRPVFVDVLSLEKRIKGDPQWIPFAQFTRTFLNPLLLNRFFNIPLSMLFLSRREGVDAGEVYSMLGFWRRLRQPFFSLITVPCILNNFLSKKKKARTDSQMLSPERARFILNSLFRHLTRLLKDVKPKIGLKSRWTKYMGETLPYDNKQFSTKEMFVEGILKELRPKRVLDVGCNTGHFSRLAAQHGSKVVAIDIDPLVVDENWRISKAKNLNVLPLVVSLASPSPAVGWQNAETKSFLERSRGHFDMVMMLAVLHHLNLDEGLPVTEILSTAAEMTRDLAIIEYVGPEDVSVKDLINQRRPKEILSEAQFEAKAGFYFDIIRRQRIPGSDRVLYLLKKKSAFQNVLSN